MKQLAKSLDIRLYHLKGSLNKYKSSNLAERRGRHKFKERQLVYDMLIDHRIPSTNGRNGRNIITISKRRFLPFSDLNQKVLIEEKVNKHGQKLYQGPRMIETSTVCNIQDKFFQWMNRNNKLASWNDKLDLEVYFWCIM